MVLSFRYAFLALSFLSLAASQNDRVDFNTIRDFRDFAKEEWREVREDYRDWKESKRVEFDSERSYFDVRTGFRFWCSTS